MPKRLSTRQSRNSRPRGRLHAITPHRAASNPHGLTSRPFSCRLINLLSIGPLDNHLLMRRNRNNSLIALETQSQVLLLLRRNLIKKCHTVVNQSMAWLGMVFGLTLSRTGGSLIQSIYNQCIFYVRGSRIPYHASSMGWLGRLID